MPATPKFILHNVRDGYADIELKYLCMDGEYFRRSMRQRIKVSNWDTSKQRMKPGAKDSVSINSLLDAKERRLNDSVRYLMEKFVPVTKPSLISQMKGESLTFWQFYDSLILDPPPEWGKHALKDYKKLGAIGDLAKSKRAGVLRRFEKKYGEIHFHSLDQNFADNLTRFMRSEKYKTTKSGEDKFYNDNTIDATLRKVTGILKYAISRKVIRAREKLSTPAKGIDAGAIYLNQQEIELIYKTGNKLPEDLISRSEINKYSDFFILGTQIGSRIGYLDIGKENKFEKQGKLYLDLSTNKRPVPVIIPLSSIAIAILDKYEWEIRKVNSTIMNRHIKTCCKCAGLENKIIHRAIEKGKLVERVYLKWQMVSTHSMRRSFATNMFKLGVPVLLIMKITGHKTIASFMRYIRIDNQEAAEILGGYIK